MRFVLLGALLSLAAWAVASVLGALAVPLALRALPPLAPGRSARRRERLLLALRLLPAALAAFVVFGLLLPAWLAYEPRATRETPGVALVALALAGAGLMLAGLGRLWRQLRSTRGVLALWERAAVPLAGVSATVPALGLDWPFPVVSVAGVLRPRLYVERRVLAACDADELDAILAHERAHLRSADNLKRTLLRACPDALGLTPWAGRLERLWSEAAETAADDEAARTASGGGPALASALVRLARLAPVPANAVVGSAVLDDTPIAHRVERLLAGAPEPRGGDAPWLAALVAGTAALLAWGLAALPAVHQLTERVVGR